MWGEISLLTVVCSTSILTEAQSTRDSVYSLHLHHMALLLLLVPALRISRSSICISLPCSNPSVGQPSAKMIVVPVAPWPDTDVKPNAESMSLPRLPRRSRA